MATGGATFSAKAARERIGDLRFRTGSGDAPVPSGTAGSSPDREKKKGRARQKSITNPMTRLIIRA
jgi:hypothetical protein